MNKLVASVFKTLIYTAICMFLLSTVLTVADTVTVYSRVKKVMTYMSNDIMRYNCIPSSRYDRYTAMLLNAQNHSCSVPSNGITSNMRSDIQVNSDSLYVSVGEQNPKDNGDIQTLVVVVKMTPYFFSLGNSSGRTTYSSLGRKQYSYDLVLKEDIVCTGTSER